MSDSDDELATRLHNEKLHQERIQELHRLVQDAEARADTVEQVVEAALNYLTNPDNLFQHSEPEGMQAVVNAYNAAQFIRDKLATCDGAKERDRIIQGKDDEITRLLDEIERLEKYS